MPQMQQGWASSANLSTGEGWNNKRTSNHFMLPSASARGNATYPQGDPAPHRLLPCTIQRDLLQLLALRHHADLSLLCSDSRVIWQRYLNGEF